MSFDAVCNFATHEYYTNVTEALNLVKENGLLSIDNINPKDKGGFCGAVSKLHKHGLLSDKLGQDNLNVLLEDNATFAVDAIIKLHENKLLNTEIGVLVRDALIRFPLKTSYVESPVYCLKKAKLLTIENYKALVLLYERALEYKDEIDRGDSPCYSVAKAVLMYLQQYDISLTQAVFNQIIKSSLLYLDTHDYKSFNPQVDDLKDTTTEFFVSKILLGEHSSTFFNPIKDSFANEDISHPSEEDVPPPTISSTI